MIARIQSSDGRAHIELRDQTVGSEIFISTELFTYSPSVAMAGFSINIPDNYSDTLYMMRGFFKDLSVLIDNGSRDRLCFSTAESVVEILYPSESSLMVSRGKAWCDIKTNVSDRMNAIWRFACDSTVIDEFLRNTSNN